MDASAFSVNLAFLSQDNVKKSTASLSITRVHSSKKPKWRAVLSVKGESKRCFGTRHTSAVVSAHNLLKKHSHRIGEAAIRRVLRTLKAKARPSQRGVQPRSSRRGVQPRNSQRSLRNKRKSDHADGIQNSFATRKRWKSGLFANTNEPVINNAICEQ